MPIRTLGIVNEVACCEEGKPGRYGLVCSEIISGHDGKIGDDFFVKILIFKKKQYLCKLFYK